MILLLVLFISLHATSTGKSLWVSNTNGNDHANGTKLQPHKTIQNAINAMVQLPEQTEETNTIHLHPGSSVYTGGELCVQNLLTGGSFEEDGEHWTLSELAEIQTDMVHVGTLGLRLSLPSATQARQTVARHRSVPVKAAHRHRVRFWARVISKNGNVASTNSVCGQVAIHFYKGNALLQVYKMTI